MKIKVCVGESCHLQGAEEVVKTFQENIHAVPSSGGTGNAVQLTGCFCMNRCGRDKVAVSVDAVKHAIRPKEADLFFKTRIQPKE